MAGFWERRRQRKAAGRAAAEQFRRESEAGVIRIPIKVAGANGDFGCFGLTACSLRIGPEGLALTKDDEAPIHVSWAEIDELAIEDATTLRQSSKIEHHKYGWFKGMLRKMPVATLQESRTVRCYVGVKSRRGELLIEAPWDAANLEGRIVTARPK